MIAERNKWLFEALGLDTREALALTNRANDIYRTGVDPVRSYLRRLATDPPGELPTCEMCDAAMDRTTLSYCQDCMDRHADDVAEERANDLEKPEALEKALAEAQRLTHELARVVAERDLLRETLANTTTPKMRKPKARL